METLRYIIAKKLTFICADDIAWDWISEKMYWTDSCTREVEVYDPTTTYRRVLFNGSSNVLNPRGIVVDPTTGYRDKLNVAIQVTVTIVLTNKKKDVQSSIFMHYAG